MLVIPTLEKAGVGGLVNVTELFSAEKGLSCALGLVALTEA